MKTHFRIALFRDGRFEVVNITIAVRRPLSIRPRPRQYVEQLRDQMRAARRLRRPAEVA